MDEQRLPGALAAHVNADVQELLAGVRAEAVGRVRERLVDAYAAALEARLARDVSEPARAQTRTAPPAVGTGTGYYVYAVVGGDGTGAGAGSPGIQADRRVSLVTAGDLTAVVSEVDLAELAALTSGDDVSEDGPLARAVRAHDAVVDEAFRAGPVVPLRFGTVVDDEAAVAGLLTAHADALRRELEHLATGKEWGVKVLVDTNDDVADPADTVDSGRDYLLAKSRRRAAVAEAAQRRTAAADMVHAELLGWATEAVLSRTPGAAHLLNASYLVPGDDELRFLQAIDRLAGELATDGICIERTGPWPPYHFVRLDLSQEPA